METMQAGRFQRIAAVSAIIAAPFSYLLMFTLLQAISFDFTILGQPAELVSIGTSGAVVFKWTMVGDIIGQYFLLLPLVLFLWYWLRPKDPLMVTLLTIGGVLYVFLGALGVSINSAVMPDLMNRYATAGPEQREVLEIVFATVANVTLVGWWGILVRFVGGLYWVGIGGILRHERVFVGWFSILVGVLALLSVIGNILQVGPLIGAGTLGYLLGFPAWALWLGLILYRNPSMNPVQEVETSGG